MLDIFLQSMSFIPVAVVGITSLLIVRYLGVDRASSVSVHAASHPKTSFILSLVILITGTLYFLNLWLWVGQKYEIPHIDAIVLVTYMAGLILALMPADKNRKWSSRLHTAAGIVLLLLMPVFAVLVLLSPNLTNPLLIIATKVFIALTLVIGLLRILPHRFSSEVLVYEVTYIGLFYVLVILLTYL